MGATDLDDLCKLFRFSVERFVKLRQRRFKMPLDLDRRSNVHGGRDRVIRRLAHIDMIVWMHRQLCAKAAAEFEIDCIRNHFVDIHVRLRAGSGLPHQQWKMPVHLAVGDVLSNYRNSCSALAVE